MGHRIEPGKARAMLLAAAVGLSGALALASTASSCGGNGDNGAHGSTATAGTASTGTAGTGGSAGASNGGGGLGGGIGGSTTSSSVSSSYPCDGCKPFPSDNTPTCDPKTLDAPKIAYPLDGLLLPPNMNVLEVQFVPPQGATLFEVDFTNSITTVKVETQCNPVPDVRKGASKGCGITLPQAAWNDIANTNRDGDPVHVTVRATADGSCISASSDKIDINFAKEDLAGGIYYWQSAVYGGIGGKTGGIYSHDFGTLDPTPVPFYTSGATGTCVGCHNLSRDGERISLATDDPDADDEFADVKTHVLDVATKTVLGGSTLSPGFQTFTHDHTKLLASTYKTAKNANFVVFDGDGKTMLATLALPAGMAATQLDLSKDDKNLVFVVPKAGTISNRGDHHFMTGSIYTAAFDPAANMLGMPKAVLTAVDPQTFYYPSWSPNGSFLVMNEAADGDCFWNRKARVKLVHVQAGADAKPLDMPALNLADKFGNSWPRWSPFVQTYKGHKLLWVTFSSNRDYGLHLVNQGFDNCYPPESPSYDQPQPLSKAGVGYESCAQPQIWMAAVIVDDDPAMDAKDRSFPAFWLPFQDVNSHNFSAQWVEKIVNMQMDGGSCGMSGASCVNAACCAQYVCCDGTCQDDCIK